MQHDATATSTSSLDHDLFGAFAFAPPVARTADGALAELVDALRPMVEMAEDLAARGELARCAVAVEGMTAAVYSRHVGRIADDRNGWLRGLIGRCVAALARALARADRVGDLAVGRGRALRAALAIVEADGAVDARGPGADALALLLAQPEGDRRRVAAIIRASLPSHLRVESEAMPWDELPLGPCLFALESDTLSQAALIAGCRRFGR